VRAATCGGHTEDAGLIFSDRAQPYLKGVACAWERDLQLEGEGSAGPWLDRDAFERNLARRALDLESDDPSPGMVLEMVAKYCGGVPPPAEQPATASIFAVTLLAAAGLDSAAVVHGGNQSPMQQLLALTDLVDINLSPPTAEWTQGWHLRAALGLLEVQGVLSRDQGEAVPHPDGVAIYPRRADRSQLLPAVMPLYERWHEGFTMAGAAAVRPGETLERVRRGDEVLAVVVNRSGGGGEADRRSAWRSWVRERSWQELGRRLGVGDLKRLEITQRSPSGRVVGLAAEGASGERRTWTGFAVRRALDLPETLFTFHRMARGDGDTVVRFIGRGWGHGIGLCQNGAYGLARSGRRFEEIISTYYAGVSVQRWSPPE